MEPNEYAKVDILKGMKRKLRMRGIRIAVSTVGACLLTGFLAFYFLFMKQTPIDVSRYSDVSIETKMQTIVQLDPRELPYQTLRFVSDQSFFRSETYFYAENHEDTNTATLYFYMSDSYMQREDNKRVLESWKVMEPVNVGILLYPEECRAEKLGEITKVYYLVYDYDHIKPEEFQKAKSEAVLLWEK